MYAIYDKYSADTAFEILEKIWKMDDRTEKLTNTLRTIFKIEGNDCEAIGEIFIILVELTGQEGTILERSKTIERREYTKCPFKTALKDISDWALGYFNIITKTINPKATLERPKAMCAGDPYCEYIWKLDE